MPPTTKRRYAGKTDIPAKQTRIDIEDLLQKHGATSVVIGTDTQTGIARVGFTINAASGNFRTVRINLPLPGDETEQEHRGRWRALLLGIRAKLVAVAEGISELDDAFMSDIVLPNGQTMREHYGPQIASAYATGQMPRALPAFEGGR